MNSSVHIQVLMGFIVQVTVCCKLRNDLCDRVLFVLAGPVNDNMFILTNE